MKPLFIFLLVLLSLASSYIIFVSVRNPDFFVSTRYDVSVINGFKNNSSLPLVIWCSSSRGDMGGRALQEGDDFSWSLETNIWGTPLYGCTMKWDETRKPFVAFEVGRDSSRCAPSRKCFWLCQDDFEITIIRIHWPYLGSNSSASDGNP
ncbi:hypothetical protein RHMOL_Rhmol06G0022700 [Rhododendron molle]|uniref:Uncharacterized protein n=1 Tax=Rhododendron molle TaxID=49168 RepID=A0ACC0N945_RHOML|nr:hypothetical protein RHMOL_Rhmol06G0022700 [Rhododendron molle]